MKESHSLGYQEINIPKAGKIVHLAANAECP
jgi:hypothetical protein